MGELSCAMMRRSARWRSSVITCLPVRDLATDLTDIEYRVFAARFLDDGAGHVFLSLKQVNLSTGVITTLMTFDSNASSPSTSYQEGNTPGNPTFNFTWADSEAFNPTDSVYYVEAQLSRSAAGGQAGLAGFSIKTNRSVAVRRHSPRECCQESKRLLNRRGRFLER